MILTVASLKNSYNCLAWPILSPDEPFNEKKCILESFLQLRYLVQKNGAPHMLNSTYGALQLQDNLQLVLSLVF